MVLTYLLHRLLPLLGQNIVVDVFRCLQVLYDSSHQFRCLCSVRIAEVSCSSSYAFGGKFPHTRVLACRHRVHHPYAARIPLQHIDGSHRIYRRKLRSSLCDICICGILGCIPSLLHTSHNTMIRACPVLRTDLHEKKKITYTNTHTTHNDKNVTPNHCSVQCSRCAETKGVTNT